IRLLQDLGLRLGLRLDLLPGLPGLPGGAAPVGSGVPGTSGTGVPGPLERLQWAWWAARQILSMPAGR
ncbi:MAG: hypothetical protein AB1816_09835, partial [Bacillota bacterium]